MYESLTSLIPLLKTDDYGEWIIDRENDGTPEHPIQIPFVKYDETVHKLINVIYKFVKDHPEYELNNYREILEKNGIGWGTESMTKADVANLDGKAVMALLFGAVRADRFCEGALLSFCKNGSIAGWLERLKELDENATI